MFFLQVIQAFEYENDLELIALGVQTGESTGVIRIYDNWTGECLKTISTEESWSEVS